MTATRAFEIVDGHLRLASRSEASGLQPVTLPEETADNLSFAARVFADEALPMARRAIGHSPGSHEAMRLVNFYAEGGNAARVCHDIAESARRLIELAMRSRGINEHARLNKTFHDGWKIRRADLAGAAIEDIDGRFVYTVADVLELLGHDGEAKRSRALAAATGIPKGAYAFHDPDYVDTVVISDDED